ncbi:DUF4169 family protein [Octadecabacter sp. R77987]|uniref:DUF4169 family protein n=1 Tax=Octadecabacter sp. R77987 TaxID=3093874 RepID=UPI00366D96A6
MKPVNLNHARKEKERAAKKARADANAVKFGRTKAQRLLDTAQSDQARARLDQLKFEDE